MTPEQAHAWNHAIDTAVKEYKNGIGAIKALKVKHAVLVEHITPHHTKQEVFEIEETQNDG